MPLKQWMVSIFSLKFMKTYLTLYDEGPYLMDYPIDFQIKLGTSVMKELNKLMVL